MQIKVSKNIILSVLFLIGLGGVLTGLFAFDRNTAVAQETLDEMTVTLPYSHQVHVQEAEIDCLYCHSAAIRSPRATVPSLQKCMTCHEYITVDEEAQPQVDQLKTAYEKGQRAQWPDVYRQPDFVYFDHSAHVNQGVACETCHGDVANMALVEKQVEMNMGFCLDCHRRQPTETAVDKARMIDCLTCHK